MHIPTSPVSGARRCFAHRLAFLRRAGVFSRRLASTRALWRTTLLAFGLAALAFPATAGANPADASAPTRVTPAAGPGNTRALTAPLAFVQAPPSRAVIAGHAAQFTVTATGAGPLTYRWQRLANDRPLWDALQTSGYLGDLRALNYINAWVTLADDSAYAGTGTATLTVKSPMSAQDGDHFRCIIHDGLNPDVTSDPVALSVLPATTPATAVAPLIQTTWNNYQWPLNAYYPLDPAGGAPELGHRLGNACGPASITRILRYWEFPRRGSGSVQFTAGNGAVWSADFGATLYDYDRMPWSLAPSAPEEIYGPTAVLSYHAATAMEDLYGSGMTVLWLGRMFTKYFNYSPRAYEAFRWQYSRDEWIALLKRELDQGRPLLVMARTVASPAPWQPGNYDGHWFVIDGYDASDRFHYAYGYGIPYPAYCDVDDIGNYNSYHRILIGLEPDRGGKTLALVAPADGALLRAGDTCRIAWLAGGVDTVHLEFSADGGATWQTIAAAAPAAAGYHDWTVPATLSTDCRLRITDTANVNVYHRPPQPFSIYARKELQLASTAGWLLQPGATVSIDWTSAGIALVRLDYSADGGVTWQTAADQLPASPGHTRWTVPAGITTRAVLRLTETGPGGIAAHSGYFVVTDSDAPTVTRAADGDTVLLMHYDGDLANAGLTADATAYGNLSYSAGALAPGRALRVDNAAGGTCAVVAAHPAFALSGHWTVETWVKVNAVGGPTTAYPWMLFIGGVNQPLHFELNATARTFGAWIYAADGTNSSFWGVGSFELGQWYHLALVGDATHGKLRFLIHRADGSLLAQREASVSLAALTLADSGANLQIGGVAGGSNVQFDGWFDELHFVRRALALEQTPPTPAATTAPVIAQAPPSLTVVDGQSVALTVAAAGAGPFTYQWYRNGVALPDATQSACVLPVATAAQAGAYTVTVTNTAGTVTAGPAALTVLDTFASWRTRHFSSAEIADPAIAGPAADPDHDGLGNLLEYALGCAPCVPTPAAAALPVVQQVAGEWIFTFHRPAAAPDLTYTVQQSENLQTWSDTGLTPERIATGEIETWRVHCAVSTSAPRFFRLQVTRTP